MAETALTFGPDWIRAYSAGGASVSHPAPTMPIPKYSLADFRYGREEMLALIPKDVKLPEYLKEFPHLVRDQFQMPLALIPMTEDEQLLWTRVNSEVALRQSGKGIPGMGRTGRGGSVDRGRGRGRGGYYQRGLMHDDPGDNLHGYSSRPKPVERSLSANERDLRWDDRDRRYDRPYSGRGSVADDGFLKQSNGPHNYWRKYDKEDEGDWRSSDTRSSDRLGGRGSWRNSSDRDRRDVLDKAPHNRNVNPNTRSGPSPHKSHHPWKDTQGGRLPEWSVEETNENENVGTFDSSGAFLETKTKDDGSDDIYISDDADEGLTKESPEADKTRHKKVPKTPPTPSNSKPSGKKKASVDKIVEEKPTQSMSELSEHSKNSKPLVSKSTSNMTKINADAQLQPSDKESEFLPVSHKTAPSVNLKTAKMEESIILSSMRNFENATPTSSTAEEDTFAHHKKATENMVAQWTEEEEQAASQSADIHLPHEKETKWFYQDPQGDIQGPFTSTEMLEWFNAGYFTTNLLLRRTCDEKFSELGDLIKAWGGIPFVLNKLPPPIRAPPLAQSLTPPITQTSVPNPTSVTPNTSQPPKQEDILALQRQLYQQQLMQQQIILRQQAEMQAILAQLKQQDNFSNLSSQQQQQVVFQHIMAQQQMPRPNINSMPEQSNLLDPLTSLPMPLLGLSMPPVVNDMSLWNTTGSRSWPMNLSGSQPPGTSSIWDMDLTKSTTEESEKQKLQAEEQEKLRKAEELRLEQEREVEKKRLEEELKRKEENRILQELQKKEEEKRRLEELKRQQEDEKRRQEELRRLEEKRKQEEELKRQEELRREEERRKQEELRKLEELKRLEELKKKEELKMQEEMRMREEQRQLEELRKKEEQQFQEEIRKQQEKKAEEKRRKEEEKKKQLEREQERLIELEKQKEVLRLKEIEREERYQAEKREREELELMKLAELKLRSQGPVWGIQNSQPEAELSLADIQRLQEEKEREEREEKLRLQSLQQQTVKQVQQNKNGLSWAKRATESQPAVKSLYEIQQEEAERLAHAQRSQKPQPPPPTLSSNAGVWGNSSHLNKITAAPQTWNTNSASATAGFWDDVISNNSNPKKQPQKSNEISAFPALANRGQPATANNSSKSKSVRAKKEEDVVTRLFGSHHKPTDEFTKWCTDAISAMPSSVDVPTFVAFLKDIESPYEVYDYVKSYLGEGKEPREFAKQFLERRSKFRNQAKQTPAEENTLWGPAPAITPSVNKPVVQTSNDNDGNSNCKGKAKRRKNRMQKLDSSMLGFTVQSNPDRLNVGEIDHVDGI